MAYAFPNDDGPRLGVAVSRKVGGAVIRNRLKRQLRDAFEEMSTPPPMDVVLVARPGLDAAVESQGFAWLTEEVADLVGKSSGSVAA